ncbi:hypothetical protein [Lactiplantibacillus daowaiensis]|uniref:Uncharacterized protein n=1 Tax=Lactiplantibacillus daowaiensis TaxID=2559918 RepID=A0ABW1S119_9LACO|nr:hypothetical protein [Lactiplantibacillus daowaiensis]
MTGIIELHHLAQVQYYYVTVWYTESTRTLEFQSLTACKPWSLVMPLLAPAPVIQLSWPYQRLTLTIQLDTTQLVIRETVGQLASQLLALLNQSVTRVS